MLRIAVLWIDGRVGSTCFASLIDLSLTVEFSQAIFQRTFLGDNLSSERRGNPLKLGQEEASNLVGLLHN